MEKREPIEKESSFTLISIIGGAFIGDAIWRGWGALIGGIIGVGIDPVINFYEKWFNKRFF